MKLDDSKFTNHLFVPCDKDCNPLSNLDGKCSGSCFRVCPQICKTLCLGGNLFPPLPSLSPPPPLPLPPVPLEPSVVFPAEAGNEAGNHLIVMSMIITGCLMGAMILVCILAILLRVKNRSSRRSTSQPLIFGTEEDFSGEDQRPEIAHHIWYINTIGLEQSVIDSITLFTYKKDEKLIEITDCSVCLSEFHEDESLRLLPKCSHAFHISCIDTWLRSHKNCPLCRAPIVSDDFDVRSELSVSTNNDLSLRDESQVENSENNHGSMTMIGDRVGEDGSNEARNGDGTSHALPIEEEARDVNLKQDSNSSVSRNHTRVRSDVIDGGRIEETEMQPMRRSVSMDTSSAIEIYNSVASVVYVKHQENLNIQSVPSNHLKSKNVSKSGSQGSISFRKLMTSSIGHALQKAPMSMKRSLSSSSSSSCSSTRHSRSQVSILPM